VLFYTLMTVFRSLARAMRRRSAPLLAYVYRVYEPDAGKVYVLFKSELDLGMQSELLVRLSTLPFVDGSWVKVGSHTIVVEWKSSSGSRGEGHYIAGEVELTAYSVVFGTYEPATERLDIFTSELQASSDSLARNTMSRGRVNLASTPREVLRKPPKRFPGVVKLLGSSHFGGRFMYCII
jgi:hypothetical protein